MDDATLHTTEEELRRALREGGLGWVVDQVDEAAGEGQYEVSVRRGDVVLERQTVERASDARRGDIATRPLTSQERLDLLIRAATKALTETPELIDAMFGELRDADLDAEAIEFVDENVPATPRVVVRRDTSPGVERTEIRELVTLLTELRGRVRGAE